MKKEMIIVCLWVLAFVGAGTCVALTAIRNIHSDNFPRQRMIKAPKHDTILSKPDTTPNKYKY